MHNLELIGWIMVAFAGLYLLWLGTLWFFCYWCVDRFPGDNEDGLSYFC